MTKKYWIISQIGFERRRTLLRLGLVIVFITYFQNLFLGIEKNNDFLVFGNQKHFWLFEIKKKIIILKKKNRIFFWVKSQYNMILIMLKQDYILLTR